MGREERMEVAVALCGAASRLIDLYAETFVVFSLAEENGRLVLLDQDGRSAAAYPPQNLAAVVVEPGEDIANITRAQGWIAHHGLDTQLVEHSNDLGDLLHTLSARIHKASRQNAELMLRMAELRKVHEELQNSYDGLRTYIATQGLALPSVGFINVPDPEGISLSEAAVEVIQPLPLEFRSLCGISLYLEHELPKFAEGSLEVEVFASDEDGVGFSWNTPFHAIQPGWMTFAFEQRGNFLRNTAALRLTYKPVTGHGPLFALGRPQLRLDKSAIVDGQRIGRALALKAWTSIPGVPLNVHGQMWPTIRIDERQITRIEMILDDDVPIADIRRVNERFEYQPITRFPNSIGVHPIGTEPTVAELVEICPAGTREVFADVETVNERGGPVEYALILRPEEFPAHPTDSEILALTDTAEWTFLPSKVNGMLSISLDAPLRRPASLWLMTRLPPEAQTDFCWARFKRIYFKGRFG